MQLLIDQYGYRFIRRALAEFKDYKRPGKKRGRGRPTSVLDDMHLADWFYRTAEEYRQAGNKKPVQQVESDLYELTRDEASNWEKWQKRYKERRLRGLQAWRSLAQQCRRFPDAAKAIGQKLPDWLEQCIK